LYIDERQTRYAAFFAENVFRFRLFHLVTSARFDHEELESHETIAPHPSLVDTTYRKNVPLFGIGIGNDFGRGNESYLNVSQGFRPLRYLDIASPFSNFSPNNNPNPTNYLTYEGGVHGWPSAGLYYNVSLFQVYVRDRIESRQITQTETVDVNTGNTRSRGAELEGSYDLLRLWPQSAAASHLTVFANASFLDARFTSSGVPGQTGKTPAYAPDYVLKAGITWREGGICRISLIADSVASQYFQDSDQGVGGTPARIPAYTVVDLSGD
jgi:Fe(3+) dicitrate transport protein